MKSNAIGVVIVTYNRLEQLKIALQAYDKQECVPKYVLVVNNNSTDGTTAYLQEWKSTQADYHKYVIDLETNTGGSGGFHMGLKKSLELDADWIWVADDDAYPDLSAIGIADKMLKDKTIVTENVTAICGAVINSGAIDYNHRRRVFTKNLQIKESNVSLEEYQNAVFEIQLFSYVGAIIKKSVLKQVGLPKKDYFILYDDTEHSMRLSKAGKILCFPAIKITHDINSNAQENTIDWKYFYIFRNKFDFYKTHFSHGEYLLASFLEAYKAIWHILLNRKVLKYKIRLEAVKDAYKGKLGVHELYNPGWKVKVKS